MKRIALISVLLSILTGINCNAEKIRVACIGDSITYGAYIENREQNSYPAQLQAYLGEDYDVRNFGLNGTTLLSKGDYPYISYPAYQASLDFNPDIVFIKLGSNDAKAHNRIYIADDFKKQYMDLIRTYRNLPSKPRVILLSPIYSFVEEERSIWEPVIANEIIPRIKEVAYECDVEIINMHNMFGNQLQWELLPDRLHPSSIGAGMMARKLYDYLTVEEDEETDIISKFPLKPVREFNFHGFKGYAYNNDGVEYYIVKPHHTAKGNPWIWRARFWGHEPQTDINLLEQGFHVTYCEVGELYGSPKAVKRWDDFYKLAVKAGLSKKAVLEGMSRGGLIIYNWAVKNTDKVACIYADAPVLDLKSWPLGQGKYRGCDECVQTMMGAYEFSTMEELLTWKGNPIDHAKKLAKAGIPMIHVVGDADEVVPVDENTTIFEDRLEEYGYDLYVIHKPGVHHHPHSLYNPEPIVSYILESVGMARNRCIHPVPGNEFRSAPAGWTEGSDWHAMSQDIIATLDGKKLELLLLGDSITQSFGGNRSRVAYKGGKAAMDEALGKELWEAAGISGERTQNLLWRIKTSDYNRCSPENAVITIGINNLCSDDDAPEDVAEGIIACALEAKRQMPQTRIILFGVLPAGKDADSKLRKSCEAVHEYLAGRKLKGIEYINPTAWFINPDGSMKTELYSGDYLHMSQEGYKVWSNKIAGIIRNK